MKSFTRMIVPALAVAFGVAAIVFGEADDAPGLVLLGLLFVGGGVAFWLKPALLTKSRIAGFVLGAIVFTAVAAFIAGWLENNF